MTLNDILQPPRDSAGAKSSQSSSTAIGAKTSQLDAGVGAKSAAVLNNMKNSKDDDHKVL